MDRAKERRGLRLRCLEMMPNHLATGFKSIRTYLIGMLLTLDPRARRPSVDGLYRDGTVHISREMHKQCFITRSETTSGASKPHKHRLRTFL